MGTGIIFVYQSLMFWYFWHCWISTEHDDIQCWRNVHVFHNRSRPRQCYYLRIYEVDNFPSIAALSLSRIMRRGEDTVGQGLIFFSLSYEFSFPFSVRGSPRGRGRPPLHTRRVFLPLPTAMAAASSSSGQPFATSGEQQRGRQLRASGRNAPPASQPLSESPATSDVAVKVEVDPAAIEEK